jgi:hypothetical protein
MSVRAKFEVLTATVLKTEVILDAASFRLVNNYFWEDRSAFVLTVKMPKKAQKQGITILRSVAIYQST